MELLDSDGPLGTRASLMMDVVVLAMAVFLPVMCWSIFQVKYRQRYTLHKRVQISLGIVLAAVVFLFEIHVRIHGWQHRVLTPGQEEIPGSLWSLLVIHLLCSVSTAVLWVFVIVRAIHRIPSPPGPSDYSARHMVWGRAAAMGLVLTAVTGWLFYWMAFVSAE